MNERSLKKVLPILKRPARRILYLLGIKKHETTDAYKQIIPPEISGGRFYELISEICSENDVYSILEIGSSSGEGSTRAIFEAIRKMPSAKKEIHCMEISKERHQKLREYLATDLRFHAHRLSSVTIDEFPSFDDVKSFHAEVKSKFSGYHIDTIKSWYVKDIQFLVENPELIPMTSTGHTLSGIAWIKNNFKIGEFDFVIIDGGEFTGEAELGYLRNSKYIALDDTNSYKCWGVRQALNTDPNYFLLEENQIERNGWAIFKLSEESSS